MRRSVIAAQRVSVFLNPPSTLDPSPLLNCGLLARWVVLLLERGIGDGVDPLAIEEPAFHELPFAPQARTLAQPAAGRFGCGTRR